MTKSRHRLWLVFERWCTAHDLTALPATEETFAAWLLDHSWSDSSVQVYAWAVRTAHRDAGHPDPTRIAHRRGGLKGRRARAERRRLPVLSRVLRALPVGADAVDVRARALFLLAYGGGLEVPELRRLTWERLCFRPEGLVVDTEEGPAVIGRGLHPASDPLRVVVDWMLITGAGWVFRRADGRADAPLTHRTVRQIFRDLGGRGAVTAFPRGLADDALRAGVPDDVVRRHLDRTSDVQQRFADRLVQQVGL